MSEQLWLDDASSLADAVRRGEVRATDVLEASLAAIDRSKLNAVVYLDAEGARSTADEIGRRVRAGEDPGSLAGVPLLVKDLEDAADMPTTRAPSSSRIASPKAIRRTSRVRERRARSSSASLRRPSSASSATPRPSCTA